MVSPLEQYVPTSNDELVRLFHPQVEKWVARHNKVPQAQEDLIQHVWERLISNRVVDKYKSSYFTVPQRFTGPQVASFMGLTYLDWKAKMWRGENPSHWSPRWGSSERGERQEATCTSCGSEMVAFEGGIKLLRGLIQTARSKEVASLGLDPQTQTWWGEMETPSQVMCVFCAPRIYGEGLTIPTVKGLPWWGQKTYFQRKDVEDVLGGVVPWTPDGLARSTFKGYLALTVSNCVKNWFRTKSRRHQEEVQEPDPITGRSWEEGLEGSIVSSEVAVDLKRALEGMQAAGRAGRNTLVLKMNQAKV